MIDATPPQLSEDELRRQVIAQCVAVRHLAAILAGTNGDYAVLLAEGYATRVLSIVGARTAHQMEFIGDMLNGMDAATEEDEWLTPIFERAQQLWPAHGCPWCGHHGDPA